MQQPSTIQFFYQPPIFNQDGSSATTHQWIPDATKPTQFQPQWDNNGGFHMTSGNSFGPGQVQGGGGQSRVQVNSLGPQQPQQPSQPTPTSTPPGIHGDMSKQPLMPNQPTQMNFVQTTRPTIPSAFGGYPRGAIQQPSQIRAHGRTTITMANNYMPLQGVLTSSPPQPAIVQVGQYPIMVRNSSHSPIEYGQRQATPYPNQNSYIMQQTFYNTHPSQQYYPQVIPQSFPSGPSPQPSSQTQPVQLMRPNLVQSAAVPPSIKQEPKKRQHAIKIIDPDTFQEVSVDNESSANNNNVTPTRSNDSSARETPQPNAGVSVADNTLAAEFAARVAARAMAVEPSDTVQDTIVNLSDSEIHHKQQSHVVPSSDKVINTVLSTSSLEFVPRSHKQVLQLEPAPEEPRSPPPVPTVSAEVNAPAVDIQRPKEQFPALKNPTMPTVIATQSPLRVNSKKQQKTSENERQLATSVPTQVPPTTTDNKDITVKKGPKAATQKEEVLPLPPKERREKTRSLSKEQSPTPIPIITPEITSSQQENVIPVPSVKPAHPPSVSPTKEIGKTNSHVAHHLASVDESPVVPTNKASQQQNGETQEQAAVIIDGNKNTRQNRNKKGNRMKDLNRKGIEKEGSDMDAFTTEPAIVNEEKERPATPISPAPITTIKLSPMPTTTPPAEPSPPSSPVDKIREDLVEKEDKLVAAKNEENTKVSDLSKPEEEEEPSYVLEKVAPQLTLKHSYKDDQWSPLNPDGKKKYERDFLMGLKNEPQSNLKPDNLPDVVAVLKDSSNNMRNQNMNFMGNNRADIMMPSFIQRNSQSQRGPITKRGSQQGNKNKGNPKMIHISLSLHEDSVKLRTVENAWKPTRLQSEPEKNEDQKQTEELLKNVRGILNKLTPQKFDTLMKKFKELPINSELRLTGVINLIFEKAVDEPSFSKAYANMCKQCSKLEVTKMENGNQQIVNFRKILITRCQTEFESNKAAELDSAKWLEEINNCNDPEKKKELQLTFEEKERQIRMKSVGNIRFIGELFKLGMLTPAIMFRCIEHLLQNPEEESLECLCKLLTTIGKELETGPKGSQTLHPYFQKMSELAQKRDGTKVSSRVRFMLQDVIELRQNKWVPRREDNNPKTIEQINKEAERESMEMTLALNQPPPRMRQNDRPDDRKRSNRNNNNQNDDGWNTVTSGSRHYHSKFTPPFDASKMQNAVKSDDFNNLSLGGSSQFRFNQGAKSVENKSGAPFASSNLFSALQERRPPQPTSNRRMTPTPSIEKDKERQRMIQGAMENDGRSSRGNSAQRDRPQAPSQPPSRDSSVPRQLSADKDNKEASEAVTKNRQEEERNSRIIMDDKALEKLDRQTNTIFEEYLGGFTSYEEVRQDIEQIYPVDKLGYFVQKALEISLEKKAGSQEMIGQLITGLMDLNLFSADVVVDQLSIIYENADDIAIDVPKVWELQAHVLVPILVAEKLDFSHIKAACGSVLRTRAAAKLLVPILTLLAKEKGAGFARKVWDSSNVSLKDILHDVNVDSFIKENALDYLTGDPPKYEPSCGSQLSIEQVQEKILQMMQTNQPYEKILDFISSNVGEKVEDLQFIRALIIAICEACLSGTNYNLDTTRFKQYEKLIQRFVENNEDKELACLNSVHILVSRLQHPQGLIMNIFNLFLEDNLISCDSFLKWKDDEHEKLENKGVSIFALTSFFSALEEVETEEEENS